MNPAAGKKFCGVTLLAALVFPLLLHAQNQATTAPSTPGRAQTFERSARGETPPLPPAEKSPVDFFRELLAMTPVERTAALTNRSLESRKLIFTKLKEYSSLDADDRELRLQATELRWYLWPLMNSPATNRIKQLAGIPIKQRALVGIRLKEWDDLPEEARKTLLENEATQKYFTETQGLTPEQQKRVFERMAPEKRLALQQGIDKWNKLSEDERSHLAGRFNQFFELTEHERQRALKSLSAPERRQIEKTLEAFGRLPAKEREQCIQSFEKFAGLNVVQREQFFQNAQRWTRMTPNEREAWRQLVRKVPSALSPQTMPPLPPDVPSVPHTVRSSSPSAPVATNGN